VAGFDVRKKRKSPEVQWFFCDKEGFCDNKSVEKKLKREA
jgi:hypothetical protein